MANLVDVERIDIDLSGIANITTALKRRSITKKTVAKMARVVSPVVRAFAPKRQGSGALKQAQGVRSDSGKKSQTGAYAVQGSRVKVVKMVTPKGRRTPIKVVPAYYDHIVEGGAKPHSLAKGSKLGRLIKRKRKVTEVLEVGQDSGRMHPGSRASRFRAKAWAAGKANAISAGKQVLAEEVKKAVEKESARLLAKRK